MKSTTTIRLTEPLLPENKLPYIITVSPTPENYKKVARRETKLLHYQGLTQNLAILFVALQNFLNASQMQLCFLINLSGLS